MVMQFPSRKGNVDNKREDKKLLKHYISINNYSITKRRKENSDTN